MPPSRRCMDELVQILHLGALGNGHYELVSRQGDVLRHLIHRQNNLRVLNWALDNDRRWVQPGTEVLVVRIEDLGHEVAVGVVHVLLVRKQVLAMERSEEHTSELQSL